MSDFAFIVILILILINLGSFILVGWDKQKSVNGDYRIPEVYFFFWSVFFSALGVWLGMFVFNHKVRKWHFIFGIGIMLLQQAMLVAFMLQART